MSISERVTASLLDNERVGNASIEAQTADRSITAAMTSQVLDRQMLHFSRSIIRTIELMSSRAIIDLYRMNHRSAPREELYGSKMI